MALAHLVILARNRRVEDGGRAFAQCVDLLAEPLDGGAVTFDLRALSVDLRQFPVEPLPFLYALQRLLITELARLLGDGGTIGRGQQSGCGGACERETFR